MIMEIFGKTRQWRIMEYMIQVDRGCSIEEIEKATRISAEYIRRVIRRWYEYGMVVIVMTGGRDEYKINEGNEIICSIKRIEREIIRRRKYFEDWKKKED